MTKLSCGQAAMRLLQTFLGITLLWSPSQQVSGRGAAETFHIRVVERRCISTGN